MSWTLLFDSSTEALTELMTQSGMAGYAILGGIIFAETGFILAPFLPGDTLLFASGTLASSGALNVFILIPMFFVASILGDSVNFCIGRWIGGALLRRNIIKRSSYNSARTFYERHGEAAIIVARYLPVIRSLVPFVAGFTHMPYRKFIVYNALGCAIWISTYLGGGYLFGQLPFVQNNLLIIFSAIALVTLAVSLTSFLRTQQETRTK